MSYVCEKSVGPNKTCDFRSGKIILQQEISRAEMQQLLETGKTSLLKGFISSRTRRKFSAYLVRGADGKTSFEFEVRVPKAGAAAVSKKAAPAAKVGKAKAVAAAETRADAKPVAKVAKKRVSKK
jgi:DNA topoisomerase-3